MSQEYANHRRINDVTRLRGVIAAAATPLGADGRIDLPKLARHCARLLDLGCDGINLLGTTGEATSFPVEQRIEAMESIARSRLPLARFMVGTGAAALADAVRLTARARELGFAGALVLPPFYYKGIDVPGLTRYFDALIDGVGRAGLKLYLYHFPQNSGVPFEPEAVDRLLQAHADVVLGLKDSSGDLAYSVELARKHPSFDVFPGSEAALSSDVDRGFAGCISATLNITSSLVQDALQRAAADPPGARALLAQATAIRSALASLPLVAAVKCALADLDDDAQWENVMPPLRRLTGTEQMALKSALASTRYAALKRLFVEHRVRASLVTPRDRGPTRGTASLP